MDMNAPLPCGTLPTELLDAGRPDPSEHDHEPEVCPHCTAALDESRSLLVLLDAATSIDVPVPAGLASRIVAAVPHTRSDPLVVARTTHGTTTISQRVARSLAEQALHGRSDTWLRRSRVVPDDAGARGQRLELQVDVAATGSLRALSDTLRTEVRTALRSLGADPMPVDIRIVGVRKAT